ncbi:MAG: nucleoside monophosphate kinase [bacterium]
MTPQTFIFAGRSGCGKGTQLKLLRESLEQKNPTIPSFSSVTGDMFRSFFDTNTETSVRAKELTARGELQPLFLTIWLWAKSIIENYTPESNIFIDGYPRRVEEAIAVDSMLKFYDRKNVIVLNFNVSRETSKARMLGRARADDTVTNAETRLDWYDKDVTPAIDFFRNKPGYVFLDIDGEKPIDEIHNDIINKLNSLQ